MKKLLFLAALLSTGVAGLSVADNPSNALNAVCVTLKSGDAKYVAFTDKPVIQAINGELQVTGQEENTQLVVAPFTDVDVITAVYHDFTTDNIENISSETGREVKAVYDLSGKQVKKILPGQVYLIKFTDGSTLKTAK